MCDRQIEKKNEDQNKPGYKNEVLKINTEV